MVLISTEKLERMQLHQRPITKSKENALPTLENAESANSFV